MRAKKAIRKWFCSSKPLSPNPIPPWWDSRWSPYTADSINTTLLIDVMLVLLIMLIITIPIQLHAVNVDLPTGNPPPAAGAAGDRQDRIDERSRIYFNRVTVETMQDVNFRLAEMAKLDFALQPELHLRPNKLARYEVVAGVTASVQRFGLTKFGIVGAEQFIE